MMRIPVRLILCVCALAATFITLTSCDTEPIEVNEVVYIDGGPGTSENRGAIRFDVRVPGFFRDYADYVEITVFGVGTRRIYDTGRTSVRFSNLRPQFYDYEITNFDWNSGGSSTGITISSGGVGVSSYYNHAPRLDRDNIFGEVEVFEDQTAIIDISL